MPQSASFKGSLQIAHFLNHYKKTLKNNNLHYFTRYFKTLTDKKVSTHGGFTEFVHKAIVGIPVSIDFRGLFWSQEFFIHF